MGILKEFSDFEHERNEDLVLTSKILNNLNISFFIETRTFLGAVRDKKFIRRDRDSDLEIIRSVFFDIIEQLKEKLNKNGFLFFYSILRYYEKIIN